MKVKTSSWHYRLWRVGRESSRSQPRDLCRYFWHLFLVKILGPAIVVGFAIATVGIMLWTIWDHPVETGLVLGGVALFLAAVAGFVILVHKLERRAHQAPARRPKVEKEPSLLRQYLSARKRKVCPLIEVINDKEVEA